MCLRVRVSACSLFIILGVACWGIDIVAARTLHILSRPRRGVRDGSSAT